MESLNISRYAFKVSASVFAAGLLVSTAAIWAATRDGCDLSRRFLEQTHQDTVRILARDLDELRRQMRTAIGDGTMAGLVTDVGSLYFQMNATGVLGVRGMNFPETWVPIQNAEASAFRAALPPAGALAAEIRDNQGNLIDSNHAVRQSEETATSAIEGTNLFLYSASLPQPMSLTWLLLLILLPLTWAGVAVVVNLYLVSRLQRPLFERIGEHVGGPSDEHTGEGADLDTENDNEEMVQVRLPSKPANIDGLELAFVVEGATSPSHRPAALTEDERAAMRPRIFRPAQAEDARRSELEDPSFL